MKKEKNVAEMNERDNYGEESETGEFEVEELGLTESEIDEWINELNRLKIEKVSIGLDIDEGNSLKINYEDELVEDEER